MKKIAITSILLALTFSVGASDFSGTYKCDLQDKKDGHFFGKLTLTLNPEASLGSGYSSYDIDFKVAGIPYGYKGMAAARGNDMGLYFESVGDKKDPDDRGVGIASIIVDKDKSGKDIVSLHKFYYEKSYKGNSNYGFENCIKVN